MTAIKRIKVSSNTVARTLTEISPNYAETQAQNTPQLLTRPSMQRYSILAFTKELHKAKCVQIPEKGCGKATVYGATVLFISA